MVDLCRLLSTKKEGLTLITECTIPPKLALTFPFTLTIIDAITIFPTWIICRTIYKGVFHHQIIFDKFQMRTLICHCDKYCQYKKDNRVNCVLNIECCFVLLECLILSSALARLFFHKKLIFALAT